jgi:hypothetical protein
MAHILYQIPPNPNRHAGQTARKERRGLCRSKEVGMYDDVVDFVSAEAVAPQTFFIYIGPGQTDAGNAAWNDLYPQKKFKIRQVFQILV